MTTVQKLLRKKLTNSKTRFIRNTIRSVNCIPESHVFDFWRKVQMYAKRSGLVIDAKTPSVFSTNTPWFDNLVSATVNGDSGVPFGSWIILGGAPGTGKTTAGLTVLNGLCKNPGVEGWHFDFEMLPIKAKEMYERLRFEHITRYYDEPDPTELLDRICKRAVELKKLNRSMAVVVDSYKCFGSSQAEMLKTSERLKLVRKEHPNLLVITINHYTKGKKLEGAAGIKQWCDIEVVLRKKNNFVYISTPEKNRSPGPTAHTDTKLILSDKGFEESSEPDFVSSIGLIQWWRSLPRRSKSE